MASVLIVEDTDLQAALLGGFLRQTHRIVGRAQTASEAVSMARSMEPEIILMDLNLERGSGIEATEAIDALETDHGIVVSTVDVGGETRSRAMAAGADAYLTKPYSQDALLDAIERVLS